MTTGQQPTRFDLGGAWLDLRRGCLFDATGEIIRLRQKTFLVLNHLAEHANQIVSRESLLDAVWPGIFVTDDSVTQCVIEIRRAIGDADQQVIRTVPKRGYMLTARTALSGASADASFALPGLKPCVDEALPVSAKVVSTDTMLLVQDSIGAAWRGWVRHHGSDTAPRHLLRLIFCQSRNRDPCRLQGVKLSSRLLTTGSTTREPKRDLQ